MSRLILLFGGLTAQMHPMRILGIDLRVFELDMLEQASFRAE
jgi:hypothetical protein